MTAAANIRAFLFEERFDGGPDPEEPAPVPEPAPDPTVTLTEHEAAVERAREEGHATGLTQGRAEAEAALRQKLDERLSAALEAVRDALPASRRDHAEVLNDLEVRATRSVLALIARLAPELAGALAEERAMRLAEQALAVARDEPYLDVRCPEELAEPLRRRLEGRLAKDGPRLEVTADPVLDGAAIALSWRTGGVEWDPAEADGHIATLIAEAGSALGATPAAKPAAPGPSAPPAPTAALSDPPPDGPIVSDEDRAHPDNGGEA